MTAKRQAPRPKRRARNSLSREEIVSGALAILDQDGPDALSMPRLARELGCGTMTLYGYFRDKEELLVALLATVLGSVILPDGAAGDWETRVIGWIRNLRHALLEHPVAPLMPRREITMSPAVLGQVADALRVLRDGGFAGDTSVRALYALIAYTFGFVQFEVQRIHRQRREADGGAWRDAVAGRSSDDAARGYLIDALAIVADDTQFEYGLEQLASGLRASLPEAASSATRSGAAVKRRRARRSASG